jgi:hypothetical protein
VKQRFCICSLETLPNFATNTIAQHYATQQDSNSLQQPLKKLSDFSVTQTNVRALTYSTWLTDSEYSKLLHEFLRVPFGDDPRTLPLDTRKRIWRLFFRAYKDSQIQDDLVVWNTYAEHNQNPLCALFFAGYCSMYPSVYITQSNADPGIKQKSFIF